MKGYFNTNNVEIMYNLGTKANNFELNVYINEKFNTLNLVFLFLPQNITC